MSLPIEDYALIGDNHTAALVGKDGSIDWLCLPRFDSPAAFAALLGGGKFGRWSIAPAAATRVERRYRPDTLILETRFTTDDGSVTLVDAMLTAGDDRRIIRTVHGIRGKVAMHTDYRVRFDYGSIVPWVRRTEHGLVAIAGPDALLLADDVELKPVDMHHAADFEVAEGDVVSFELTYFASHLEAPPARAPEGALDATEAWWRKWAAATNYAGPYRDVVVRSLLTLKALTYAPSGGIIAAPTTSLPECPGGVRNWDYRYCWLRDAAFTLFALLRAGYTDSAEAWRAWLLRAIAGSPEDLQIVYGVLGSRRLPEIELEWLPGYENSQPVRIGNGAHLQFQLDVFGEVIGLLYGAHRFGIEATDGEWDLARAFIDEVAKRWREPDRGIWEMRGDPRQYTHSKVMAWGALDRGVRFVEQYGMDGPVEQWRRVRDEIHADVCANAFDEKQNSFMQSYGSPEFDAATLLIATTGFLPPDDPRVLGTIAAIERRLVRDGLVYRYTQPAEDAPDGLPRGEAAFLACSFWLVDNYVLLGRMDEAKALFERLCLLTNDVGLLAEEYDPQACRQLGNFPQAFSHVGLINSAMRLAAAERPGGALAMVMTSPLPEPTPAAAT
jgi:GH15 family glucan-1,4-alpha-glucosidase